MFSEYKGCRKFLENTTQISKNVRTKPGSHLQFSLTHIWPRLTAWFKTSLTFLEVWLHTYHTIQLFLIFCGPGLHRTCPCWNSFMKFGPHQAQTTHTRTQVWRSQSRNWAISAKLSQIRHKCLWCLGESSRLSTSLHHVLFASHNKN